jgi:hypothetical protein
VQFSQVQDKLFDVERLTEMRVELVFVKFGREFNRLLFRYF